MAQPYDYSINVPNPVQGFLGGLQVAQEMRKQQQAQAQAEQKRQQEAAFLADLQATMKTPSPDKWQELYAKHPMMYEQISAIKKETSPAAANLFTQTALGALQFDSAGDTAGALNFLNEKKQQALNGGMVAEANKIDEMIRGYGLVNDPTQRRAAIAGTLAVYAQPEQFDRISKVYSLDMPTPIAEYQARLRKDGKEAADEWWKLQSGKFMTTDDQFIDVGEYIRNRGTVAGAPAPKGVTFTRVKPSEGGQTGAPSGSFRGQ